jgi:hypothetical protein
MRWNGRHETRSTDPWRNQFLRCFKANLTNTVSIGDSSWRNADGRRGVGAALLRARALNMAYRAVIRLVDGDEAPDLECWCEYAPGPIGCGDEAPDLECWREYAPGPIGCGDEAPDLECWREYAPGAIVYAQYSHEVNQHLKSKVLKI